MTPRQHLRASYAVAWLLISILPALALWLVTLGMFNLDIRESWAFPIFEVPGWCRHEITWFVRGPPGLWRRRP
jgi:hypothetical protein